MFGTPSYMAPEYITTRQFTAASDLFALGMVLYEMLAGRPAVAAGNMYETLHRIVNVPFAPPGKFNPDVDARLAALVMKAIAKDPNERFASAGGDGKRRSQSGWNRRRGRGRSRPGHRERSNSCCGASATKRFSRAVVDHRAINRCCPRTASAPACCATPYSRTSRSRPSWLKLVNAAYYNQFGARSAPCRGPWPSWASTESAAWPCR